MATPYQIWDTVLGRRDTVKYPENPNNTVLARCVYSTPTIVLRHFGWALVRVTDDGGAVINPYYSLTSGRRLYSAARQFGWNMWRERDSWHYRTPDGECVEFHRQLTLAPDGTVMYSDVKPRRPWENARVRTKVVKRAFSAGFKAWAANPLLGCAHCSQWAHDVTYQTPESAWKWLTAKVGASVPVCVFHSTVLHKHSLDVTGLRFILADMPKARRVPVLRAMRKHYEHATLAYYDAVLGVGA